MLIADDSYTLIAINFDAGAGSTSLFLRARAAVLPRWPVLVLCVVLQQAVCELVLNGTPYTTSILLATLFNLT